MCLQFTSHCSLKRTKDKVWNARLRSPLFNTRQYAHDLESLLMKIWRRHESGLECDHISCWVTVYFAQDVEINNRSRWLPWTANQTTTFSLSKHDELKTFKNECSNLKMYKETHEQSTRGFFLWVILLPFRTCVKTGVLFLSLYFFGQEGKKPRFLIS